MTIRSGQTLAGSAAKRLDRSLEGSKGRLQARNPSSTSLYSVISHEFAGHCHRETLEELPPSTPVFAADVAAGLIRTRGRFNQVITTPPLGPGVEWSRLTVGPLPNQLAIGRVVTPGNAFNVELSRGYVCGL
ncbi:hypothetical protein J3459_008570 [Metarhizium acridum]|nr:hypothetical protein J3459_008570 [Metarhizium acridum]